MEKKSQADLTPNQRDALSKKKTYNESLVYAIFQAFTKEEFGNLEGLVNKNSSRTRSRHLPNCHVHPSVPRTVYMNLPVEEFPTTDTLISRKAVIATTNPMNLDTRQIGLVINEFVAVCCVGSLARYLAKQFMDRHIKDELKSFISGRDMTIDSMWIVQPVRYMDACDIVGVPNPLILQLQPDVVRDRIRRYGLQYLYDLSREQ